MLPMWARRVVSERAAPFSSVMSSPNSSTPEPSLSKKRKIAAESDCGMSRPSSTAHLRNSTRKRAV